MFRRLLERLRLFPPRVDSGGSPLEAYDRAIDTLELRGVQLRRSAAAMLAMRGGLERDRVARVADRGSLEARITRARARGERRIVEVLELEASELAVSLASTQAQLARTSEDAAALLEQAGAVQRRLGELRRERAEAEVILNAGRTLSGSQQPAPLMKFEQRLALEAARDEVARVEALTAIQRAEAEGEGDWP